jgi:hypothetical protein
MQHSNGGLRGAGGAECRRPPADLTTDAAHATPRAAGALLARALLARYLYVKATGDGQGSRSQGRGGSFVQLRQRPAPAGAGRGAAVRGGLGALCCHRESQSPLRPPEPEPEPEPALATACGGQQGRGARQGRGQVAAL